MVQGVPYSPLFSDPYHSGAGGIEQTLQVFLQGNGLPQRWQRQAPFHILETGFGIRLNFLVTLQQWQQRADRSCPYLHYVALEKHPPTRQVLSQMLAAFPALSAQAQMLLAHWPVLVPGFHQCEFKTDQLRLTLILGDIRETLPQLSMAADAVFLDGFAPSRNPEMWSEAVLRHLARQCNHEATLATWCVAGAVRRALEHHGFSTARRPGFGGKRHRLEARFDKIPLVAFQRRCTLHHNPALHRAVHHPHPPRQALIIGAGLAGCLMSEALVRRGWQVHLLDRHQGPAQETSGNPAGIMRPSLSRDDNAYSQLCRAGFLYAQQTLGRLSGHLPAQARGEIGVLLAARSAAEALQQQACVDYFIHAPDFVRFCLPGIQGDRGGLDLPWGGLFFPGAGWVSPVQLCQAALEACQEKVQCQWQVGVHRLVQSRDRWQALDDTGRLLAEAPVAILAVGAHGADLALSARWPLQNIRGQITLLEPDPFPVGTPVLCQDGYLIPGLPQGVCIGATYVRAMEVLEEKAGLQQNLLRLQRWHSARISSQSTLQNRTGTRAVSRDRMPLMGPVAGSEGLFALMGLGSHGLIWSALGAHLIGAWLEHEPLPLPRSLLQAISPSRHDLLSPK